MDIEQIERAKKKADELIKYHRENAMIKDFIDKLEDNKYLQLFTANQDSLGLMPQATFDLLGREIIELLKENLKVREYYLEKLNADNLIE